MSDAVKGDGGCAACDARCARCDADVGAKAPSPRPQAASPFIFTRT